jgi:hypothetical protein
MTTNFFSPLSFVAVLGSGMRDPVSGMGKNQDPGSGINIPDPPHWLLLLQLQLPWLLLPWLLLLLWLLLPWLILLWLLQQWLLLLQLLPPVADATLAALLRLLLIWLLIPLLLISCLLL